MNKKFTVLVGLLMAVVVTGYSVSGTYAKYTETFNGTSSTATIAKWNFSVNDNAGAATFTFDLLETLDVNDSLIDTSAKMIAPGSTGKFTIKLNNQSDVKAKYTITFDDSTGATVPLKYTIGKTDTNAGTALDLSKGTTGIMNSKGAETITVDWEWPYNGNDAGDTAIGKDTKDYTITVKVVAEQYSATLDAAPAEGGSETTGE